MGMGGGGSNVAVSAHVHTNDSGQGGALNDTSLINAVTIVSRFDNSTVNEDTITTNATTTSTSLVNSTCSFTVPNDNKLFIIVAESRERTDSASSTVKIGISGGDNVNQIDSGTHDTANVSVALGTTSTGTQTGQTVFLTWAVGAGTGTIFIGSNMFGFGVGA